MMKHSIGLMVAVLTTALAGCSLYFGGEDHDGTWHYCGEDGYYECEGEDCFWRGPDCPAGVGSGSQGGFECRTDVDCAAGCYCANGLCEEAGFCAQDSDCGNGYICDETRSSCVPEPEQPKCESNDDCAAGQICTENGRCSTTCTCSSDQDAANQGFDFCDELRQTCMTGTDPAGTCAGQPTCNLVPPQCAAGDVPLLGADGCWTGECQSTQHCAEAPPCGRINDQQSCLNRTADCQAVYVGHNCTKPDGTACNDGDQNCTCTSFTYDRCRDKVSSTPRMVRSADGLWLDASQLIMR